MISQSHKSPISCIHTFRQRQPCEGNHVPLRPSNCTYLSASQLQRSNAIPLMKSVDHGLFGDAKKVKTVFFSNFFEKKNWKNCVVRKPFPSDSNFLLGSKWAVDMITIYSDLIYPGFPEALVDNPPAFEGLQSPFHETPGPEGKKNLETRRFKGQKIYISV